MFANRSTDLTQKYQQISFTTCTRKLSTARKSGYTVVDVFFYAGNAFSVKETVSASYTLPGTEFGMCDVG